MKFNLFIFLNQRSQALVENYVRASFPEKSHFYMLFEQPDAFTF